MTFRGIGALIFLLLTLAGVAACGPAESRPAATGVASSAPQGGSAPGLPRGGTAGQFLKKNSGTDYDVVWAAAPGGGLTQAEVDARIAALRPNAFTSADEAKLDGLGVDGAVINSVSVTPILLTGSDVEARRVPGQRAYGTFSGDTGDARYRILRIDLDGTTDDLDIAIGGSESDIADAAIRVGDNYLFIRDSNSAIYSARYDFTTYRYQGDYRGWFEARTAYTAGLVGPISEASLVPEGGVAGQFLGYGATVPEWQGLPAATDAAAGVVTLAEVRQHVAPPIVPSLPSDPFFGQTVEILGNHTYAKDRKFAVTQGQTTLRRVNINRPAVANLYFYSGGYTGVGAAALAGRGFVNTGGTVTKTVDRVRYGGREYAVSRTVVGGLPRWREITGLGYDDVQAGEKVKINILYTDGSKEFPDGTVSGPEVVVWNGTDWITAPTQPAPWARAGQPAPHTAIAPLADGAGVGLSFTNSSQDRFSTTTLFAPVFDLDDADKQTARLDVQARINIATGTSTLALGSAMGGRTHTLRGWTFASELRGATSSAANAVSGVKIDDVEVYNGSAKLGNLALYLERDSQNRAGYRLYWDGQSGGVAASFGMYIEIGANYQAWVSGYTHEALANDVAITATSSYYNAFIWRIGAEDAGLWLITATVRIYNPRDGRVVANLRRFRDGDPQFWWYENDGTTTSMVRGLSLDVSGLVELREGDRLHLRAALFNTSSSRDAKIEHTRTFWTRVKLD